MKNRKNIFIPFLDGLLSYDCKECGYCCYLSGNLKMNIEEKTKLIRMYPSLRYFFTEESNKTYNIKKFTRCWFLEDSGFCSIQKEHGYSYKPFMCRLYPFYVATCKDEYVVSQEPNPCLMLYVGKGERNKGTSHKQILKNARQAIDYHNLSGEINWPIKRLALEKKILEGSKKFLNKSSYLDFVAYQMSLTTKNPNLAEINSKLLKSVNLWKSFLGIDSLNLENKRLTYELTAITSLLRVESIRLSSMPLDKVPLALLALYFYILLFTKTRKPKMYVQTYKQVLGDVCLGLILLEKGHLRIKDRPLEEKVSYLRKLQMLSAAIPQNIRKSVK